MVVLWRTLWIFRGFLPPSFDTLKEGASLHVDDGDEPLLFRALSNDMNSEIIKLLIEYGADASYVSEEQETALQIACRRHEYGIDTLALLLEHGCPINVQKSECGNSPLGNAALADHPVKSFHFHKEGADQIRRCKCNIH